MPPVADWATGAQTAVIGTEHSLTTVSAAGVYTFHVNPINMTTGDVLTLTVYRVLLSGTAKQVELQHNLYGSMRAWDITKQSWPLSNVISGASGLEYTLKQFTGTARVFPWEVIRHS